MSMLTCHIHYFINFMTKKRFEFEFRHHNYIKRTYLFKDCRKRLDMGVIKSNSLIPVLVHNVHDLEIKEIKYEANVFECHAEAWR